MKRKITVLRADTMGFCMGVKRALDIIITYLDKNPDKLVMTLGPLIHNGSVLADLEKRGVRIASDAESAEGTVVIRAHGIAPGLRKRLIDKGVNLIDATCPRVIRSQKAVEEFSREGGHVVLVGDRDHGEVTAVAGCADSCDIIQTVEQAKQLYLPENTLVISQTTVRKDEYDRICRILLRKNPGIKIIDSICPATQARQDSAAVLADKVDAVVIIGGKNSANTKRLYLTVKASGKPCWHIEDTDDLPAGIFQYGRIGLSAGASTPDIIINAVENMILQE